MVQINRDAICGRYRISDIFPDIGQNPILLRLFETPSELTDVLEGTAVIISDRPSYMKVDNADGSIFINPRHLMQSDAVVLYLDIIHELVHVKQHRQGLNLYDRSKAYVDRETEIEAYAFCTQEARRLGLSDAQILDYLRVEWITPEEHLRLARRLNLAV
ncbi:MAG: ImmA/IrrE family metallo-endopeptidase [Thermodesulfobacteriota bacterium]